MDGLPRLIFAVASAFVGILAPRFRYATLMISLAGVTVLGAAGLLLAQGAETWMMVAALPLAGLGAAMLARWLPRLATLVVLALALALGVVTVTGGRPPGRWIAVGVAVLLLALGTWRARPGLVLACATIGACLAWGIGPFVTGLVPWAATLAAYLVVGGLLLHHQGTDVLPPAWPTCRSWGAVLALGLAAWLASLPLTAPELAPAGEDVATARRGRLHTEAPRGGLVWPLPSEAIVWDAPEFPAFENLDALYLGDRPDAGIVKLPGTQTFRGRFALNGAIHRMRAIKDEREIELLKRASSATVEALRRSLHLYHDGGYEGAIAEAIRDYYTQLGCEGDSFPPIIASGAGALEIHYMRNDAPLAEGEVVITDIGCYAEHYASDYTRTLPVGGRFAPRARELYQALYEAERAAASACRAGVYYRGRETPDGSKSLDAIARDTLAAHGAPSDFKHGIGHPIGLFAHDVFRLGQPLEAGMVIMIEPGIYVEGEGVGMRIENAYIVKEDGCELITGGIPTEPDALERLMAEALAQ